MLDPLSWSLVLLLEGCRDTWEWGKEKIVFEIGAQEQPCEFT